MHSSSILQQLKIKTWLFSICLQYTMKLFGHIAWCHGENLKRLTVSRNVEGQSSRGCSPTDLVQQVTGGSFHGSLIRAED